MKKSDYLILAALNLAVIVVIASAQSSPGYMDADYYYSGGLQLAAGKGFNEPFLWNYLDNPAAVLHPSHTYWMPLASLIAAAGMLLVGKPDFLSARLLFFVIAACIPLLTTWLTFRITHRYAAALTAGGLAVFPGYYAIYLGLTETFAIYMSVGTLFLCLGAKILRPEAERPGQSQNSSIVSGMYSLFHNTAVQIFLLGGLAGLMHLTRADGILWFAAGFGIVLWLSFMDIGRFSIKKFAGRFGLLCAGYLLVMGFWYARNLDIFRGLFPPGNSKTIWLVEYDELFTFPSDKISFSSWAAAGLSSHIKIRWEALVNNMQTLVAVQSEIFLFPLVLAGLWRLRKKTVIQIGGVLWLATSATMTLIFPFAGARGGYLHSGAAFQPILWAAASEGLIGFIELGIRWRNWKMKRASIGFGILTVMSALLFTVVISSARLLPQASNPGGWNESRDQYQEVGAALDRLQIQQDEIVMVNNPPGFFVATGRSSIVIPDGDESTLIAASEKYGACCVVLEENTVKGLQDLYKNPADRQGLKYMSQVGRIYLFRVIRP